MPGISVQDAFGLPDFSLADSLKGLPGTTTIEQKPVIPDNAPNPDTLDAQKLAEREAEAQRIAEEAAAGDGTTTIDDDKKAADEAAAKLKEKNDAAAAKKTADAAAKKPADGKKVVTDPKAAVIPAKVVTPATPAKIKVGDKEFSPEEIQKKIAAADKAEAAAEAVALQEKKKASEKPALTPEQQATEDAKVEKQESEWITGTAQNLRAAPLDEATVETILTGGKPAVEALDRIRREDMARTVLAVRKDLGEQYKPYFAAVEELHKAHVAAEDRRADDQFVGAYPHLKDHLDLVKQHASALAREHGDLVKTMSMDDFNAKVAELTVGYIRKFNPQFGVTSTSDGGAGAAAAKSGGAPAGPGDVSAAAKTLAAAKARVTPKAPAGNVPGGQPAAGGKGGDKEFQKSAVASLM